MTFIGAAKTKVKTGINGFRFPPIVMAADSRTTLLDNFISRKPISHRESTKIVVPARRNLGISVATSGAARFCTTDGTERDIQTLAADGLAVLQAKRGQDFYDNAAIFVEHIRGKIDVKAELSKVQKSMLSEVEKRGGKISDPRQDITHDEHGQTVTLNYADANGKGWKQTHQLDQAYLIIAGHEGNGRPRVYKCELPNGKLYDAAFSPVAHNDDRGVDYNIYTSGDCSFVQSLLYGSEKDIKGLKDFVNELGVSKETKDKILELVKRRHEWKDMNTHDAAEFLGIIILLSAIKQKFNNKQKNTNHINIAPPIDVAVVTPHRVKWHTRKNKTDIRYHPREPNYAH